MWSLSLSLCLLSHCSPTTVPVRPRPPRSQQETYNDEARMKVSALSLRPVNWAAESRGLLDAIAAFSS